MAIYCHGCRSLMNENDALRERAERAESALLRTTPEAINAMQRRAEKAEADVQRLRDAGLALIREVLEEVKAIVKAQPYYPDTNVGMRQQWVKDQIVAEIGRLETGAPSTVLAQVRQEGREEERTAAIRDVCMYCAGKCPPYNRTPGGPNVAGNYVHERNDGARDRQLCRASAIYTRAEYERRAIRRLATGAP